jgi:hypothetical protein
METAQATIQNTTATNAKGRAKKAVLLSLSSLALGALAFFGYKHLKNNNDTTDQTTTEGDPSLPAQSNPAPKPHTSVPAAHAGSSFPIKLHAKGAKVLELQHGLMRTYGDGIFPKYGADGDFGTELATFLKSKGYAIPVSEADFNKITKGQEAQTPATTPALSAFDPAAVAKGIYYAIQSKDYSACATFLKSITSVANYSLVSEQFKNYRVAGGVRQTLLNAVLSSFTERSQKENSKQLFAKIGLKHNENNDTWSLSGINGLNGKKPKVELVTLRGCLIYKNGTDKKAAMLVPANTIIGTKVRASKSVTFFRLFDTDEQFHVKSECVRAVKRDGLSGIFSKIKEGDYAAAATQALAVNHKGDFNIIPKGVHLGKVRTLHRGTATIETELGTELRVNENHIKKINHAKK